jgi:hypothetical protein
MELDDRSLRDHSSILAVEDRCLLTVPRRAETFEIEYPQSAFFRALSEVKSPASTPDKELAGHRALFAPYREAAPARPIDDFDIRVALSARRAVRFVDYVEPGTFAADRSDMEEFAKANPMPAATLEFDTEAVQLPDRLTRLCALAFAANGSREFHNHRVLLKSCPSLGGRHGIEAFIVCPQAMSVTPGIHYFHPVRREFYRAADTNLPSQRSPHLVLSCVFERYQWRYRSGWAYYCILLDLGHILAAIELAASELGIAINEIDVHPYRHESPWRELVHEPLFACTLELSGATN